MLRRGTLIAVLVVTLAASVQAQTKLEYRRPQGVLVTTTTKRITQTLSLAGMEIKTAANVFSVGSSTAEKPGADGLQRLQLKQESLKVDLDLPGGLKVAFDSARPDEKANIPPEAQPLLDVYRSLVGARFVLVTGVDGRARSVEGIDHLIANAPAAVAESLKQQFTEGRIKREHNQEIDFLPAKAVKPGDRWRHEEVMDVGGGQELHFVRYFEYLGTVEKAGRTLDKLGVNCESVVFQLREDSPLPFKVTRSDLTIASSAGTVLFDRALGQVVERTSSVRITGSMTFHIMGMDLPGALDLSFDDEVVTTTKK